MEEIIDLLVSHYHPNTIICFGYLKTTSVLASCFATPMDNRNEHYFLLMITTDIKRIEHEVQEFVNRRFKNGTITILVHSQDVLNNAITKGSRFFSNVCRDGFPLYPQNGFELTMDIPKLDPLATLASAEKHYRHRYKMAVGFLEAADHCFGKDYDNNCVFFLHQAVEQACMAIIRVYIAYRGDLHSLDRLLNLCRCFSIEPATLFQRKTEEDRRLFELLQESYSDARYRDSYMINSNDADLLCIQVREFLMLTQALCLKRIKEYQEVAEESTKITDFLPALPASLNC